MDFKVYKKEEVLQPNGKEMIFTPDIIDLVPIIEEDELGNKIITGAVTLADDDHDLLEQQCTLATIWQQGMDPLSLEVGCRWSEALLEEINPLQLMSDITAAVEAETLSVVVVFDTFEDAQGNSFLSYTFKGVN